MAVQVERLGLTPGEVAVIRVEHDLTREHFEYLRRVWRDALPDNRAIILGPGVTIEKLTDEERARLLGE